MSHSNEADSYFRTVEVGEVPVKRGKLKHVTVKSPALKRRGDLSVYVPEQALGGTSVPVVTLLHGVYGSHWCWIYKAHAHLTLQRLIDSDGVQPMVLVTPSDGLWGDGSGYLPHHQEDYETWIVNDVSHAVSEVTGNGVEVQQFIGGLSMGGYGALRIGASHPEFYDGFAGHSSITEFSELAQFIEEPLDEYPVATAKRMSVLDSVLANKEHLNPFRFDCGVEDQLLEGNRKLKEALEEEGIAFDYEEFSGGHEWSYWEEHIEQTFRFFSDLVHG